MKSVSKAHALLVVTTIVFFGTGIGMSLLPDQLLFHMPVWLMLSVGSLAILAVPLLYCMIKRVSLSQAAGLNKTRPVNILMAVLVLLCSYPVVVVLNFLSMLFVENAVQDTMVSLLLTTNLPVMLLVMAVLPAVSEEFLFRGILYNTYRKTAPLAGVLLSALFFALLHGNFNQIPYAFFLGIVLALMMEATGSVIIPMIMHFLLNGSNVLISYAMKPALFQEQLMNNMNGVTETGSMLQTLMASVGPDMLQTVIVMYAVIGLFFAAAVAALIYATFMVNKRPVRALIIPGRNRQQRFRLLDWWVAVYIGLILVYMLIFG